MLSAPTGADLRPKGTTTSTLDFYQEHIPSRLRILKRGAAIDGKQPCIEEFSTRTDGTLTAFEITVGPAVLRHWLGQHIPGDLELPAKLMKKILGAMGRPAEPGPRIDYRKQVELLTADPR